MGLALAVAIATIAVALWLGHPAPLAARIAALGPSAAILGLWLAAAVARVALIRFTSPDDFDAAAGSAHATDAARNAGAILQNTLEQVALALIAQVALALTVERATLLLGVHLALFTIGRTLFWAGYRDGAEARALGFALTFYPSVLILMTALASRLSG